MSNYLEEVKLKKERKKYLESHFVGKKAFVLCCDNVKIPSFSIIESTCGLILKQLNIAYVDNALNIIGFDNNYRAFHIEENIADDMIILDLEHLKELLISLFIKQKSINVLAYSKSNNDIVQYLNTVIEINLDKLFTAKTIHLCETGRYLYSKCPYSKIDIGKEQPLILCFDKNKNEICLKETSSSPEGLLINSQYIESLEDFENGFYYGLDEVPSIVEDILNHFNDYFSTKLTFKKILDNIFSLVK